MTSARTRWVAPAVLFFAAAETGCGSDSSDEFSENGGAAPTTGGGGASPGPTGGTGAAKSTGGQTASGGAATTGGESATGGSATAGGAATGGATTGGSDGEGGAEEGGSATTGGDTATGGSATAGSAGTAGASTGGGGGDLEPPPGEYGERADLLLNNSEMAVAEAAGKIYVLGGYDDGGASASVTTVLVYDPALDMWDTTEPLPEPLHHPVAIGVAGKVYSLGGQTPGGETGRTIVLDPAAPDAGWVDLMPMPTARGAGAAAVIDDQIYVVGGRPPANNEFEMYDISEDMWVELDPLPDAFAQRNHLIATAIGGKVYVAGGRYDGGGFGSPRTASLDVYDPELGWDRLADMLRERGGLNGIAANGCFFVWGGEGSGIGEPNDVYPDHDVYNPMTDMWTSLDPLPTPVHGVTGAAFLGGLIYMPGGGTASGGGSGSTIFQVYRPDMSCE